MFCRVSVADIANAVACAGVGWAAIQGRRLIDVGGFSAGRCKLEVRVTSNVSEMLNRLRVVGTGTAVSFNDPFGKQVVDGVGGNRLVGGKDVVKGAVLAHDD